MTTTSLLRASAFLAAYTPALAFQSLPTFASASYPVFPYANAFAAGDLDEDGLPDFVVAHELQPGILSILRGSGSGALADAGLGFVSDYVANVALADVNGDRHLDVVAACAGVPYSIDLLFGDGLGGFSSQTSIPAETYPYGLAVGDLDGDRRLDIVVTDQFDGVSLHRGHGDGTFAPFQHIAAAVDSISIVLADLDGDDDLDLVVGSAASMGAIAFVRNQGGGNFAAPVQLAPGAQAPRAVAVGDLDGDHDLDLALARFEGSSVSVLLGDGAGGFSAGVDFDCGPAPISIAIGDLDLDGDADLLVCNHNRTTLSVLAGNGAASFAAPIALTSDEYPSFLQVVDVDVDGRPDVVASTYTGGTLQVFANASLDPLGVRAFGRGTPGCVGSQGASAASIPVAGSTSFAAVFTNAPPRARGTIYVSPSAFPAGWFPFAGGPRFLLDPFAPGALHLTVSSDASGLARVTIPLTGATPGTTLHAQSFWSWSACSPGPRPFSSTRALEIVVQP